MEDPETGERVRKEVPVRSRPWFWKDDQGTGARYLGWVGRSRMRPLVS